MFFALSPELRRRIEHRIREIGSRLSNYPMIDEFDANQNTIYLIAMGHRRDVYR